MKHFFILLLSLLILAPANSQTIQWEKSYGGTYSDVAFKVIKTRDGGYLVGATTESTDGDVNGNHGVYDVWLIKINNIGEKEWQKCLGGLNYDGTAWLEEIPSGGYLITGNTTSNGAKQSSQVFGNHGDQDIWVIKVDDTGEIEWRQCFGGCGRDEVRSFLQSANGDFVFVGGSTSYNTGDVYGSYYDWDAWVVKISPQGAFIWQKVIGGSGIDYFYEAKENAGGDLLLAGLTSSVDGDLTGANNKGQEDLWVCKLSASGDILWNTTFGGSGYDGARGLCLTQLGTIMVTGTTYSGDGDVIGFHGDTDAWVVHMDMTGSQIWNKAYGGFGKESGYKIFQRHEEDFIIGGEASSTDGDVVGNHGNSDAWVFKIGSDGSLKKQICLGGSDKDYARDIIPGESSELLVGGTAFSSDGDVSQNFGLSDVWLVNLSIPLELKHDPQDFGQLELSPNPVKNEINIKTPDLKVRKLEIFDSNSKLILTVQLKEIETTLHLEKLASGVYLLKASSETGAGKEYLGRFVKI